MGPATAATNAVLAIDCTVEIDGREKPTLVATTLNLLAVSRNP